MLKNLTEIEAFLYSTIPPSNFMFPGEKGLERIKTFLQSIDNPQNKVKAIHIAGTSGKGSTAHFVSLLLQSQGFKTGLTLSPHISDIRERFQINHKLLSEKKVVKYFNALLPFIINFNKNISHPLSYFEILMSLAFYIFQQEKVDYAIVETGLGGLYDGTNVISNPEKIVILTKIGLDHTNILGQTINKIAQQKAGIIQKNNSVISIAQEADAKKVIEKTAQKKSARLLFVEKNNYQLKKHNSNSLTFDFQNKNFQLKNIRLDTPALYQMENCALALTAISQLGIKLSKNKLLQALTQSQFSGRMETVIYQKNKFILDGAHNPQKMKAFIESLAQAFPSKKFTFILSFKKNKDYQKMLSFIIPLAEKIYLTSFECLDQDSRLKSEKSKEIANYLVKKNYLNWEIVPNPIKAIRKASQEPSKIKIITGSFYLLASIYHFLKEKV